MQGTILSSAQYASMRNKLKPAIHDTRRKDRESQLKQLSQDKIDRCSNTLEALRKKKLTFVEEKARKEEEGRQEVDRLVSDFDTIWQVWQCGEKCVGHR